MKNAMLAAIALVMLCGSFMLACAEENNANVMSAAGEVKEEAAEAVHTAEEAAANVTGEVKEEAGKAVEETKETVTSEKKTAEKATEETKQQPGFEAVFAVTGLVGVSYLILRRRQ